MSKPNYPFFAKDTFGLNYYKVISDFEGLKVGKYSIEMQFKEIEKLVRWKISDGGYDEFVPVEKDVFDQQFIVVQKEMNKIHIHNPKV